MDVEGRGRVESSVGEDDSAAQVSRRDEAGELWGMSAQQKRGCRARRE